MGGSNVFKILIVNVFFRFKKIIHVSSIAQTGMMNVLKIVFISVDKCFVTSDISYLIHTKLAQF